MTINFIGRWLFPKSPDWKQRRQTQHLLAAILVGFIFAGTVVAIMFFGNGRR